MLSGENLARGHQNGLHAAAECQHHQGYGNDRLAGTDIPLQEHIEARVGLGNINDPAQNGLLVDRHGVRQGSNIFVHGFPRVELIHRRAAWDL